MNMKRMSKWFVAVAVAVLGAAAAHAGDSASFALDTRTGTRIARETEPIAYSTAWSRGANVQVSVDGVLLKTAAAPASGTVVWNAAEAGPGVHTLTHVSGGTTLTAQFAVFGVQVESADPAKGSITLAWTDLGGGVTYSVWRGAGESRADAECVTNGLAGNTWTDYDYWCAPPVLSPLNYWVVAQGGGYGERASEPVETRHRFGVFVGVNKFKDGRVESLPMLDTQAELFGQLARENGGFPDDNVTVLTGRKANKAAVGGAIRDVAEQAQTGDYVVIFCNSHGGADNPIFGNKEFLGVVMYDTVADKAETLYTKAQLASDLEALATANGKNGLNVVVVMNTCYAGGAVSASPEGQNFAWIVACREAEEATHDQRIGAVFAHFLVKYGWKWGGGAKGSGATATFADLADYAMPAMDKLRQMGVIDEHPETKGNQDALGHFIAGWSDVAPHGSAPKTPTGLNVERQSGDDGKEILFVSWTPDDNADYFVCRRKEDGGKGERFGWTKDNALTGADNTGLISYVYELAFLFQVAAVNEHGISDWFEPAQRGTLPNKFRQWFVEKVENFKWNASTPAETVAAAATAASANGLSYEACYIAGVDPTDAGAAFEAELSFEDGKCTVRPVGGEKEGRVYRVHGKKEMSDDEEWTDVTDVEDLAAEGWRFFRVGVEMAE